MYYVVLIPYGKRHELGYEALPSQHPAVLGLSALVPLPEAITVPSSRVLSVITCNADTCAFPPIRGLYAHGSIRLPWRVAVVRLTFFHLMYLRDYFILAHVDTSHF